MSTQITILVVGVVAEITTKVNGVVVSEQHIDEYTVDHDALIAQGFEHTHSDAYASVAAYDRYVLNIAY